jgi:uridine phosphorylase
MTKVIPESELILTPEGNVYHLDLSPEDIADTIITVGDPDRVSEVSKYFDRIEIKKQHREFITHTGTIGPRRLTVISTGIGADNIDIVMNELDALVNIDLKTRTIKDKLTSLSIIRIGTAGGLQDYLDVDSFVVSEGAFGMDGLLNHYRLANGNSEEENDRQLDAWSPSFEMALQFDLHVNPVNETYYVNGDEILTGIFKNKKNFYHGLTVTCSGFYGPQGRVLRLKNEIENFIPLLNSFNYDNKKILNFEMETAAIYGLGKLMGHYCCSLSVIIANRITHKFSKNAAQAVDQLIQIALESICKS